MISLGTSNRDREHGKLSLKYLLKKRVKWVIIHFPVFLFQVRVRSLMEVRRLRFGSDLTGINRGGRGYSQVFKENSMKSQGSLRMVGCLTHRD